MANKRDTTQDPPTQYWTRRLRSRDFKKVLSAALQQELHHLASLTLAEAVDGKLVHDWIDDWDAAAIDQKHLIELTLAASGAVGTVVRQSRASAQDLLGAQAAKHIETLIFDTGTLSQDGEELVRDLMQQDFTRQLFTEIIFTSIVSFNKKVNPLFANFAMRAMEDQIKGFINLFMPMIQKQAAGFAVDNQAALLELLRTMIGEGLRGAIGDHLSEPSAKRKTAGTALLRQALHSSQLEILARAAAHAVWDSISAVAGKRTLGELLSLDKHAAPLATQAAEVILPVLSHAPLLALMASEITAALENTPAAEDERPRNPARKRKT